MAPLSFSFSETRFSSVVMVNRLKPSIEDLAGKLSDGSLLKAFDPADLASLLERSVIREAPPGTEIIRQGESGDFAIVLLSGSLKVSIISADGNEIILGFAQPGEIIGEIGLIDQGVRTATITAAETSQYLRISRQQFMATAGAHPEALWRMLQALAQRLRDTNRTIESDRSFSMAGRLARSIMSLVGSSGDGRLRIQLSQTELGSMAGLSRENVSRQLGAWTKAGIIVKEGRRYRILNRAVLSDLAEFGEI